MLRNSLAAAAAMAALSAPAFAHDELHAAIVAAMGEAIEDPRYGDVLANYGLDLPDLSNPTLVNSANHPYPEVTDGTLLDRVIDTGSLRLGWIAVGSPWSVPSDDDPNEPKGLSVEYWDIIRDKFNAHYGTDVSLDWVEYTDEVGNNNMYRWLATTADPECNVDREVAGCYDVIGGAYAINEQRKKVSRFTPAYFPLNMSVVRTNVPLPDGVGPLENAEQIREAMADPNINIAIAGLPDTGEDTILTNFAGQMGETFTHLDRTPGSNVLEFAQDSEEAHFVMGTNVRMSATRLNTPDFCADCEFIPNLLVFGGVGFATALVE